MTFFLQFSFSPPVNFFILILCTALRADTKNTLSLYDSFMKKSELLCKYFKTLLLTLPLEHQRAMFSGSKFTSQATVVCY